MKCSHFSKSLVYIRYIIFNLNPTGLPHECFQKILKGKVYKAMNGAIAGKYSSWAGVKEFAQKHTHGAANHQIKLSELYRCATILRHI